MNTAGQTICLVMIVKNEAPVIRRCLESVRPIIDHWVIVDTGSTDGTQDFIRADLEPLPGTLYERPWQDFAHNRSEALALARSEADYSFIIDADDMLLLPDGFVVPELTADCYVVDIEDPPLRYQRTQLVLNTLPWRYQGVLHEYLTCEGAGPPGHFPVLMRRNHDGARRRDPATYRRDAAVLEDALRTETDPFLISRYRFYLAQSYRDCGERENALTNYLARAELGGWAEEVYISLYFAAQLKEALNHPEQEVIDTYQRASDLVPTRVEALHGASRFCRYKSRNEEGYQLARRGLDVQQPAGALFVEPWIYETGLLDEYAVNAYWSGHYREALDASLKVLATGKVSAGDMPRIIANARFSAERVTTEPHKPNLGSLGAEGFIEQHALVPARNLHARLDNPPRVLIAILAKQKEASLPLYLECIEALDYPKSSISLYIRTNNNTDRTEAILRDWVARVGKLYAGVEFDAEDVAEKVEQFGVHEWNATRFSVLGHIRNVSMQRALQHECEFYFVSDVDNFVRPCTLRELVALNLPIVAPFLRAVSSGSFYSNYHAETDNRGYYLDCDQYQWVLNRWVRGIIEVAVVHCTYLVRADVLPRLSYTDSTDRHEYVVFSDIARQAGVPQYFDNRQIYGYITFDQSGDQYVEGGLAEARRLMNSQRDARQMLPSPASLSPADPETALRTRFGEIYQNNEWGFGSGSGSLPANNAEYVKFLQSFIQTHGITSVVDFGCGDWQFSRDIDWQGANYVGIDLVPEVIENNRKEFGRPGISFEVYSGLDDIKPADLLLCKDVFQHLPNALINEYLVAFKRKFKFLLITNDERPDELVNRDIEVGGWRPVLLDHPPFSETAPIVFSRTDAVGVVFHKATCLIDGDCIPKIFHFIYLSNEGSDAASLPFLFVHLLAIRSALRLNPGFVAKFYHNREPIGSHWDAVKSEVELVCVEAPDEVFGRAVDHLAHKADVLRLQQLFEHGGIYLDLDTICQRPFTPLFDGRVVLGQEKIINSDGTLQLIGLCNAMIIAPRGAEFIRIWLEKYREFTNEHWNKFSVQVPLSLSQEFPELVRVEPHTSFFWPSYDKNGLEALFVEDLELPDAYSIHLWGQKSWDYIKNLNEEVVFFTNTTYNKIARQFIIRPYDSSSSSSENLSISNEGSLCMAGASASKPKEDTAPVPDNSIDIIAQKFSEIYAVNSWAGGSGPGSFPENCVGYMEFLQSFMLQNGIKSVVDFGCGDWQFSNLMNWSGVNYIGLDIVESVIQANRELYSRPGISFRVLRTINDVPAADLLVCKDVLQHLPNETISKYIKIFREQFRFSLITNDDQPAQLVNTDIDVGGWRPLRLDLFPFFENAPIVLSRENRIGGWKHNCTYLLVGRKNSDRIALIDSTKKINPNGLECNVPQGPLEFTRPIGKTVTTTVPDIKLINLERSTDRMLQFFHRNPHLGSVQRVPAIDGASLDREELVSQGLIAVDLDYEVGALGCALSHISLWQLADKTDTAITIFEDDVVANYEFQSNAAKLLSQLPENWDLVQWGYVFDPCFLWVDLGFAKSELRLYDRKFAGDLQSFQNADFVSSPVRLVHSFGTQAYSISPAGARTLLSRCLPLRKQLVTFPNTGITTEDKGIDVAMCAVYGSMLSFICIPPLVVHDDAQISTIRPPAPLPSVEGQVDHQEVLSEDNSEFDSSERLPPMDSKARVGIVCDIEWLESCLFFEPWHIIHLLNSKYGYDIINIREVLASHGAVERLDCYDVLLVTYLGDADFPLDEISAYKIFRIDDLHHNRPSERRCVANSDMVISPYAYLFDKFQSHGNVVWVPYSAAIAEDDDVGGPCPNPDPICKIFVSGHLAGHRPFRKYVMELDNQLLAKLAHPGYTEQFGGDNENFVRNKFLRVLRGYICCFTDAVFGSYRYVLLKNFEIASTGALLLTDKAIEIEMNNLGFIDYENCIFCEQATFLEKINWILDPVNRSSVDRMRLAGMELVKSKHLSQHRAEQIDELVRIAVTSRLSVSSASRRFPAS